MTSSTLDRPLRFAAGTLPSDAETRLAALRHCASAGVTSGQRLDHLARLAGRLLGARVALLTLADEKTGAARTGHRFLPQPGPVVILDAVREGRAAELPPVAGLDIVRFFACVPLSTTSGHRLGSLCLASDRARDRLDPEDLQILDDLAAIATDVLLLQPAVEMAEEAVADGQRLADELQAMVAALDADRRMTAVLEDGLHRIARGLEADVRVPVNGMSGVAGLLISTTLTPEQRDYVEAFADTARDLRDATDRLLAESRRLLALPAQRSDGSFLRTDPSPRLAAAAPPPGPPSAPAAPAPTPTALARNAPASAAAAPVAPGQPPLFAPEVMAKLMEDVGGAILGDLVASFRQNMTDAMAGLEAGRRDANLDQVWRRSHEILSITGAFGLLRMSTLARQVEQAAKRGAAADVETLLDCLFTCWPDSREQLDAFLRAEGIAA